MLKAFSQIRFKHDSLSLLILGDGPDLSDLESKYQEESGIHFLGYREDVGSYLRAADVAIIPSTREGMSTFVLEALFHGLAVISTNVGGIQDLQNKGAKIEILSSNETNDIAVALEKFVLMRNEEREHQGTSNQSVILNNFLWQSLSHQTVQVYESVIDEMNTHL